MMNTKGLDQLIKALKNDVSRVRVGVLGSKSARMGGGATSATNASIGAIHEFGTSHIPMRSFLRMPLSDFLQTYLDKAGAFNKAEIKDVIKQGSVIPWLQKVAIVAERIVSDAFATGGFGKWPGWKTPGYRNNDNRLLVDTRQLRDSISSEVK